MDNPEPLATLGTQDTGQGQTEQQKKPQNNTMQKTKKMRPQSPSESQG